MPKDLLDEYRDISEALTRWFISQEIDTPKAAGAMCYLLGVILAEHAASHGSDVVEGIDRHVSVVKISAALALQAGRKG